MAPHCPFDAFEIKANSNNVKHNNTCDVMTVQTLLELLVGRLATFEMIIWWNSGSSKSALQPQMWIRWLLQVRAADVLVVLLCYIVQLLSHRRSQQVNWRNVFDIRLFICLQCASSVCTCGECTLSSIGKCPFSKALSNWTRRNYYFLYQYELLVAVTIECLNQQQSIVRIVYIVQI